jgi:hypothetical protein
MYEDETDKPRPRDPDQVTERIPRAELDDEDDFVGDVDSVYISYLR